MMMDNSTGREKPEPLVASQRGYSGYDAISSSTETNETSPLFDRPPHTNEPAMSFMMDEWSMHDLLSPSSSSSSSGRGSKRGSRCSKVGLIFAGAVVVGALLWLTTYTYSYSSRLSDDDWDDHSANGDDNYEYTYTYERRSLMDMIPLLGKSRVHSAQSDADNAKNYLNSKAALLGSSHSDGEIPEGCESTVIVLRHCEKGDIREHCNYIGYERSVYLASLFGNDVSDRWPAPSYLFAEQPSMRRNPSKRNFRELETILPLSEKFDIDVDSTYSSMDSSRLGRKIFGLLKSGDLCGKVAVVSWKHSKIPVLANHLGCGPKEGCPWKYHGTDFDSLWQIKFVYHKPFHSNRKSLKREKHSKWLVYGFTQKENFDPLAFSKQVGDYPRGGTETGGRWRPLDHEIEERPVIKKNKKTSRKNRRAKEDDQDDIKY